VLELSTEQVLIATLVAGVVVALGTAIIVLYTPFGNDLRRAWRWVGHGVSNTVRRIGTAGRAIIVSLKSRRSFWLTLLLLIVGWALAGFVKVDLTPVHGPLIGISLLFFAAVASTCALALALTERSSQPPAVPMNEPVDQHVHEQAARAKRFALLHQQLWAAASAIKTYGKDGRYTDSEQVKQVNGLIYKLLGEGEDLTTFVVPSAWVTGASVENSLLLPRIEGLLIYLNGVDVTNRLLGASVRSLP
jgi:hypothetical protein